MSNTDNWFNYGRWYQSVLSRFPHINKFAEVGVHAGRSICFLSNIVKNRPDVEVHAIDIWEDFDTGDQSLSKVTMAEYEQNVESYGTPSIVTSHKCLSWDAAELFKDGYFDLVYIDADHSYKGCSKDIQAWLPKMKKGSILAGHDFWNEGVKQAVYDNIKGEVKYFSKAGHVWEYIVD